MTIIKSSTSSDFTPIQYPSRTLERANRAIGCAPFQLHLYTTMRLQSVELKAMVGSAGVENRYTASPLAELAVENTILWLIQVGVLRREVDGQGITDSFRLTPLGRQLVEQWQQTGNWLQPSFGDRLYNCLSRWLHLG